MPPLDHDRVYRLKRRHPDRFIGINGGIRSLDEAARHLAPCRRRHARPRRLQTPAILAGVDHRFYGGPAGPTRSPSGRRDMVPYAEELSARGGRLSHLTRHMLGLFHGRPGARHWRQALTRSDAADPRAGVEVLFAALAHVEPVAPVAEEHSRSASPLPDDGLLIGTPGLSRLQDEPVAGRSSSCRACRGSSGRAGSCRGHRCGRPAP